MRSNEHAPFVYRDFCDVPRILVVTVGAETFLLDGPFDDARDDYPDVYQVYRMPRGFVPPMGDWSDLPSRSVAWLGEIPVREIEFDPTRRRSLSTAPLSRWLSDGERS